MYQCTSLQKPIIFWFQYFRLLSYLTYETSEKGKKYWQAEYYQNTSEVFLCINLGHEVPCENDETIG